MDGQILFEHRHFKGSEHSEHIGLRDIAHGTDAKDFSFEFELAAGERDAAFQAQLL